MKQKANTSIDPWASHVTMGFHLGHDLDLECSSSNMEFAISQPKMVWSTRNHEIWPWPWHWPWIFKVKYVIRYISAKNGPIDTKQKANTWTDLWASNVTTGLDLGYDLDLEFSSSNMEFAISRPKMVRSSWNKSKHIDWTLSLKCDHRIWHWLWSWPWIFKVIYEFAISQRKMVRLPQNEKRTYKFNWRPQLPQSSTSAMTLKGVRIYRLVTGVTSDVGVPSTHPVLVMFPWSGCRYQYICRSLSLSHGMCLLKCTCVHTESETFLNGIFPY